jgi:penicillin-binding protein 2
VSIEDDVEVADDFPGAGLPTFKLEGSIGKNGLEARFDRQLQGEAGGTIYRIDPARYREKQLTKRLPIQGNNLVSSIDIDLQLVAESQIDAWELKGTAWCSTCDRGGARDGEQTRLRSESLSPR